MAVNEPHVLIVAGSDSSGGAGIARDIETMAELGVKTCLAVTAVTVQTHEAAYAVEMIAPALVAGQMQAAFDANPISAVKIGMLASEATVAAVAGVLRRHPAPRVVLDPVLASTSGRVLLPPDAIGRLKRELMPLCDLVTPNLHELAILAGCPIAENEEEILRQASCLLAMMQPRCSLLAKGGHASGAISADILLSPGRAPQMFEAPRLNASMRGTGCMLASAVAARLAMGASLGAALTGAKMFVHDKLLKSAM